VLAFVLVTVLFVASSVHAQSSSALQGRVFDSSGAVLRGATISVRNDSTGFNRSVASDSEGRYHVDDIPAQTYDVTAAAQGFKSAIVAGLTFDVGRTLVRDFRLEVGPTSETLVVKADIPLIDRVTTSAGTS